MNYSATEIIEKYKSSVLKIVVYYENGEYKSHGSAVVLKKENAIITNYHNIYEADSYLFYTAEDELVEYSGLIAVNAEKDLAIFNLTEVDQFPELEYSNSNELKIGEEIISIGFPNDYGIAATDGIISSKNNKVEDFDLPFGKTRKNMIKITSSISDGNSGGPLFNLEGKLIGISTLTDTRGQSLYFAICIEDVLELYNNQINNSDKYSLDFEYQENMFHIISAKKKGDSIKALRYIEYCIELYPEDEDFLYIKIKLLYDLCDFQECICLSEKYLNKYLNLEDFFKYVISISYIELNEYSKSLIILEKLLKKHGDIVDILRPLAKIYYNLNRYDESFYILEKALKIKPNNGEIYFLLSELFFKKKQYFKAARYGYTGIKLKPDNINGYKMLGIIYNHCYHFEKATEFHNKAIYQYELQNKSLEKNPGYWACYANNAYSLFYLNKYDEALKSINRYIQYNINDNKGYSLRSQILFCTGDFKSTLADISIALSIDPKDVSCYDLRSKVNMKLGKYEESIRDIETALELEPDNYSLQQTKAEIYYNSKKPNEAINICKDILVRDSNNFDTLKLLFTIYTKQAKVSELIEITSRLIILVPNNEEVQTIFTLANSLSESESQPKETIKQISAHLEKGIKEPIFYYIRGLAYFHTKEYRMAISDLNIAIKDNPENAFSYFYRGVSLLYIELYSQSILDLEKFISLDFKYEEVTRKIIEEAKKENNNIDLDFHSLET